MSEYYPTCINRPCPICGDTSGDCSISEYGYALVCYGKPKAQKGELQGFWKCFRSNGKSSQWEDQRGTLENQYRNKTVKIRLVDSEGNPLDLKEFLDKYFKEKFGGGES